MTGLDHLTATEARRLLSRREISAGELVEACLARIALREGEVGAFEHIDADGARERARALDAQREQGPLHGLPVGIKDIIDTATMPTRLGSPAFHGRRPDRDAACVRALQAAGAIVLGKNVTTEFAYFTPGKTRNPHNLAHTPGGSSSGSAAAVADFMVPLSIGTQAAGSTIRPASFCGVVGFKPTHDRWDMTGALRLYPSIDTLSVFARSVADAALVDAVLGGGNEAVEPRRPRRVLFFRPAEWPKAQPATREALARAAALVEDSGVPLLVHEAAEPFSLLVEASDTILHYEACRNAAAIRAEHRDRLSPIFLDLLDRGEAVSDAAYARARDIGRQAAAAWRALIDEDTLVITPSVPGEAPEGLGATGDPVFIRTWNVIGAPSINLPLHAGPKGLPVGIQAVGQRGGDRSLLSLAAWFVERARGEDPRLVEATSA